MTWWSTRIGVSNFQDSKNKRIKLINSNKYIIQCKRILSRPVSNGMLVMWCERAIKLALFDWYSSIIMSIIFSEYCVCIWGWTWWRINDDQRSCWKIGDCTRWINTLCHEGRIDDAVKLGTSFAIPSEAEKPEERRTKSCKYIKKKGERL